MYHEDQDKYWFEVPRPNLGGSYGKYLSFEESRDLLESLPVVFPLEGFEGFEFSKW